ncbi:DUF5025 domain-containing protein [Fibrella aquatica]|uniref:DUF5025 domain-containing protein n=1 Tax=Fibrella aquatica TaxID=3242487 RepID=UPI003521BD95
MPKVTLISGYCLLALLSGIVGCHTDRDSPTAIPIPANSFSMQINGRDWKPYQNSTDPCYSTFKMQASALNHIPFYRFYAWRDSIGRADTRSQDALTIQIMNVTEPGAYPLNGTWKAHFESYVTLNMKQASGANKRYINSPDRTPFVVTVRELITDIPFVPGLIGSFAGTLYAEDDSNDSLVINQAAFAFLKLTSNFDHCQ